MEKILVLNSGSSSLKYQLFNVDGDKFEVVAKGLADRIGITPANLSILKTGKAKAIRFSTLEAICKELDCQPADILEFKDDES